MLHFGRDEKIILNDENARRYRILDRSVIGGAEGHAAEAMVNTRTAGYGSGKRTMHLAPAARSTSKLAPS